MIIIKLSLIIIDYHWLSFFIIFYHLLSFIIIDFNCIYWISKNIENFLSVTPFFSVSDPIIYCQWRHYIMDSNESLNESFRIGLNFLYTIHTIYRKILKKGSGWLNLSADYWNDEISARLIFPQRQLSNWNSAAKLIGSRGWTSMCHTHKHSDQKYLLK